MQQSNDFFDFTIYPLSDTKNIELHGNNAKQTLIICQQPTEEQLDLLKKILQAIQFNMLQDILLYKGVSTTNPPKLIQLLHNKSVKHILIFGYSPSNLGLQIRAARYKPLVWKDYTLLFAHSLEKIATDTQYKKALWTNLQVLFLKS